MLGVGGWGGGFFCSQKEKRALDVTPCVSRIWLFCVRVEVEGWQKRTYSAATTLWLEALLTRDARRRERGCSSSPFLLEGVRVMLPLVAVESVFCGAQK